ncbi:MAG: hypothetical protein HYU81_01195 [Candidatus Brennerbacteria bacterium]|nr:hypothetical protein [Candidatus Brennerbacteria bacterium]
MATATFLQKLNTELKRIVAHAVLDTLTDPDLGAELTLHAKRRLRAAARGRSVATLAEIKKKHY